MIYGFIDNDTRHHSGQNAVRLVSQQQILTTVMTRFVVDKTIYHAKPHSICFLLQYQRNEIFVLTTDTDSDLKVHALHYANDCLNASDFPFKTNMQKKYEKKLFEKE